MKKEDLFSVLGDIDEELVRDAAGYRAKRKSKFIRWAAVAATAVAAFALVFNLPGMFRMGKSAPAAEEIKMEMGTDAMEAEPERPAPVPEEKTETVTNGSAVRYRGSEYSDMDNVQFLNSDRHWKWWSEYNSNIPAAMEVSSTMEDYYAEIVPELLLGSKDNTVCSPLNTYIAFSVLAQMTEGESRQQMLTLLKADSIETVDERFGTLWATNSIDTPRLKSMLSNSVWLRDDTEYNSEFLDMLEGDFHVQSFTGKMGSKEMNDALRNWTDEATKGLLKEYTKDMGFDRETVIKLLSTIYYKAAWVNCFNREATDLQTFHGEAGDSTVDMMHTADTMQYYSNESFETVSMSLLDSGNMHVFLPRKGVDVETLAGDSRVYEIALGKRTDEAAYPVVTLAFPKFSVNSKVDLIDMLRKLGVTDILDPGTADFEPVTDESIYLSSAEHAAMVEVDEEGVTGAAYTEMAMAGSAAMVERVRMTVDRPFLFMITGRDGSILFAGIVRNID